MEEQDQCTAVLPSNLTFIKKVWPWIDFCLFSLFPFIIILISNVTIVGRLLYIRYLRRSLLQASNEISMTSLTAMQIAVSVCFLVTTSPIAIFHIIYKIDSYNEDYNASSLTLSHAVLNIILYTNNAIKFLLFVLSSPRFGKWTNESVSEGESFSTRVV